MKRAIEIEDDVDVPEHINGTLGRAWYRRGFLSGYKNGPTVPPGATVSRGFLYAAQRAWHEGRNAGKQLRQQERV